MLVLQRRQPLHAISASEAVGYGALIFGIMKNPLEMMHIQQVQNMDSAALTRLI